MSEKAHVLVIGAGFTGCAVAHDLALRGFQVTVVERGDLANGTSGRTHGLLHSGARYCVNDPESAVECLTENLILRRITPQCIEPNGGLFVALDNNDLAYAERFADGTAACGIPTEQLSPHQALALEPNLCAGIQAAFLVPDGTFDPLRLALAFAATARANGAVFHLYCEVEGMLLDRQGNVTGVRLLDRKNCREEQIRADMVVSCAGSWAGQLAGMAGLDVPVKPTPGVMVAFEGRLVQRAINRLCEPDDGDIVLPQRRMLVVGTTSFEAENIDYIPVFDDQVKMMVERGAQLVPAIREAMMRGAFMSSRPLVGSGGDARSIARTFKCFDHQEASGVDGLLTITGGKATTCRAMAEKAVDMVCLKLGIQASCQTAGTPLLSYRDFYRQEPV